MTVDPDRRTPLNYAALAGDVTEVEALLATGEDPNAADRQGFTPLHFGAQERKPLSPTCYSNMARKSTQCSPACPVPAGPRHVWLGSRLSTGVDPKDSSGASL